MNKDIIITLHGSIATPHHEYALQFWSLAVRHIAKLESMQRKATEVVNNKPCKGRLLCV